MYIYVYMYIYIYSFLQMNKEKVLLKTEDIYIWQEILLYVFNIPYLHPHSLSSFHKISRK